MTVRTFALCFEASFRRTRQAMALTEVFAQHCAAPRAQLSCEHFFQGLRVSWLARSSPMCAWPEAGADSGPFGAPSVSCSMLLYRLFVLGVIWGRIQAVSVLCETLSWGLPM